MRLKDLVGYKLEKINDNNIIVSKDNELYTLTFVEDEGDCCGYNDLKTELLIDNENKPIITNVEYEKMNSVYCEEYVKITFFGSNKEIAKIESTSSSGSGWQYGACVSIECKDLNIDEVISQW